MKYWSTLLWLGLCFLAGGVFAQETKTADLSVSKDNGTTTVVAGEGTVYTIVVANNGPDSTVAEVTDQAPSELVGCNVQCTPSGGATCGSPIRGVSEGFSDQPTLPASSSVSYQLSCQVSSDATGILSNTASATPLGGVIDEISGNDSATDDDEITQTSALSIQETSFRTAGGAIAGAAVSYSYWVQNDGPSDAVGAMVLDTFAPVLSDCSWTCSGPGKSLVPGECVTTSGQGNIAATVNLPRFSALALNATCTLASSAAGQLSNTATIERPAGTSDLDLSNNVTTRVDPIGRSADLAITKSNGVDHMPQGGIVTYTMTVTNPGPSDIVDASVTDTFAPEFESPQWSCLATQGSSCGAAGTGNISDPLSLIAGGSATYTATARIALDATGSLGNSASVAAPAGTDPNLNNNQATDTDPLMPEADLTVIKDNGKTALERGTDVTYTITVSNDGPSGVTGASVVDTMPAELVGATWSCIAAAGASCTGSGSGDIDDSVDMPPGSSVTYTVEASIDEQAQGTVANTASAGVPEGVSDPDPENNSSTDEDTVERADLEVTVTTTPQQTSWPGASVPQEGVPGTGSPGILVYEIRVANLGPDDAFNARVVDSFSQQHVEVEYTCAAGEGADCPETGGGDISELVDIPAGETVTFTVTTTIGEGHDGTVPNQATVLPPSEAPDPSPSNNSATIETPLWLFADGFETSLFDIWDGDDQ